MIDKNGDNKYQFVPFKSTNIECPIIGYDIEPQVAGVTLSSECLNLPCHVILFDFLKIKVKTLQMKILVKNLGNRTFYSSLLEISFISKVFPYFENPLQKLELILGK